MSTIVPVSKLTRRELRMLGENVMYAVERESQLAAVNRSLAAHDEAVAELLPQPADLPANLIVRKSAAPSPRPAA